MRVHRWTVGIGLFVIVGCGSAGTQPLETIPASTTATAVVTTTSAAVGTSSTLPTTTTAIEPVWMIFESDASEGFGVYDRQTSLFDLEGRLVAEYPGNMHQGDAGRVYYWSPDSMELWRDPVTNFVQGVECQPPFPGFDPTGPFLATCGDPPRSIVEVDPVTGDILEQRSGSEALEALTWRVRWATTGPDGAVIVQVGFECEVPVVHVLTDGIVSPMLPPDQIGMVNSIHMGWTSGGDDLIHLLGSACGHGLEPGAARLTEDGSLIQLWEGEGSAFRWRAAAPAVHPNDNIRERALFAAFASLGVEACCGEPSHGSPNASTGMTWEGIDYFVGAAGLAEFEPLSDPIHRYQVDRVEVAVGSNEPGERHVFACGDTIYSVANYLEGTTVAATAVEALVSALGCTN